jgi:hypothetical protein
MDYIGGSIMKCENMKCGKEHDGSYGSGRFCCRSCANTRSHTYEIRKKVSEKLSGGKPYVERRKTCLNCGEKLKTVKQKKYCSSKCQHEYQHKQFIMRWKNGEEEGMKGKGSTSCHIRKYLWEKHNNQCSRCGWNTPNPVTGKPILEIEHIDGNWKNNKPENLDLICPNCHSLTTTYMALNYGNAIGRRK